MQVDPVAINRSADLLGLIGADTTLRRTCGTNGGEFHGACPFCGGTDRFIVQPRADWPHWWCRQCSDKAGDAIDYVRKRDGLSFSGACDQLSGVTVPSPRERKEPSMDPVKSVTAPPLAWQGVALELVEEAEAALWAAGGAFAREYLGKRGLSEQTMREAHLGYVARDLQRQSKRCAAGITIPWFFGGDCWQVKVRRRSGEEPKYDSLAGGHPSLYVTPAGLPDAGPLVLTEGEFDALLLAQEVRGLVAVASLGSSTTGAQGLPAAVAEVIARYDPLLLAYDNDEAGLAGAAALNRVLPRATRIRVPDGKDITAFWQRGGRLRDWVQAHLARLSLLDRVELDEQPSAAREDAPTRPETCEKAGCRGKPYLQPEPETGGFCARHSASWQLLNTALLVGEPIERYRELAVSGGDIAIADTHAALVARLGELVAV